MVSKENLFRHVDVLAAMVTDTALLRNPNCHQPTDLPDTIDFDRLAKLTDALVGAVRRLTG